MSPTQPPSHKANKLKPATNLTTTSAVDTPLLGGIRQVIEQARGRIQQQVNSAMVEAYWQIGRLIVEHEQKGEQRADYGKQQLQQLAAKLTAEFGKGFDLSNLRRMRSFYNAFPIQGAVRPELSWTHYRYLIAIENHQARQWYLQESISQNWSARTLDRQASTIINSHPFIALSPAFRNNPPMRELACRKSTTSAKSVSSYRIFKVFVMNAPLAKASGFHRLPNPPSTSKKFPRPLPATASISALPVSSLSSTPDKPRRLASPSK
jgi:predicted nuclease of restriction endonuclease-like (RecB) superfamily